MDCHLYTLSILLKCHINFMLRYKIEPLTVTINRINFSSVSLADHISWRLNSGRCNFYIVSQSMMIDFFHKYLNVLQQHINRIYVMGVYKIIYNYKTQFGNITSSMLFVVTDWTKFTVKPQWSKQAADVMLYRR